MPALATSLVCKNIAASTWTGARVPCCICPTIFLAHHSISNGTVPSFQCTSLLECFFWARRPRSRGLRQEAPDWTVVARVQRFQLCLQKSALYSCRGREAAQHKNDCVEKVAFELELHWGSLQAAHHAPSIPGGSDPRSSLMREGRVPCAPTPKVLEDRFGYPSEVPLVFSLASFSTPCTCGQGPRWNFPLSSDSAQCRCLPLPCRSDDAQILALRKNDGLVSNTHSCTAGARLLAAGRQFLSISLSSRGSVHCLHPYQTLPPFRGASAHLLAGQYFVTGCWTPLGNQYCLYPRAELLKTLWCGSTSIARGFDKDVGRTDVLRPYPAWGILWSKNCLSVSLSRYALVVCNLRADVTRFFGAQLTSLLHRDRSFPSPSLQTSVRSGFLNQVCVDRVSFAISLSGFMVP